MRAEACGASYTLIACTPSRASCRAPSISFEQSMPLGGTISTRVTNLPSAINDPRRERCAKGAGGVSVLIAGAAPVTSTRACSSMARMAARMARM